MKRERNEGNETTSKRTKTEQEYEVTVYHKDNEELLPTAIVEEEEEIIDFYLRFPRDHLSLDSWVTLIKQRRSEFVVEEGTENPFLFLSISIPSQFDKEGGKEGLLRLPPQLEQFYKRVGQLYRLDYLSLNDYSNNIENDNENVNENLRRRKRNDIENENDDNENNDIENDDDNDNDLHGNLDSFRIIPANEIHNKALSERKEVPLFDDSKKEEWCTFATEGGMADFLINCSPASKYFGVIITITEGFYVSALWRNFDDFLQGIPNANLFVPKVDYRCDHFYGKEYSDRFELNYYIKLLIVQSKKILKISRILFCSSHDNYINVTNDNKNNNQKNIFNILPMELIYLIIIQCGDNEIVFEYECEMNRRVRRMTHEESSLINLNLLNQIIDYAKKKETIGQSPFKFRNYLLTCIYQNCDLLLRSVLCYYYNFQEELK